MTSPSVDLDGIMPYGVNVSAPTNTTCITPDGNSSRVDGSFVLLPVGPCQVQFTWPGKQDAYVRWMDSANNEKGVPIEISGRVLHSTRRCVPDTVGVHGAGSRRSVVETRRGQCGHNQDVSDSRRPSRGAALLAPAHDSNKRRRPIVNHHHTSPERRRAGHIHRFATHLPTTSVAAGVVA